MEVEVWERERKEGQYRAAVRSSSICCYGQCHHRLSPFTEGNIPFWRRGKQNSCESANQKRLFFQGFKIKQKKRKNILFAKIPSHI